MKDKIEIKGFCSTESRCKFVTENSTETSVKKSPHTLEMGMNDAFVLVKAKGEAAPASEIELEKDLLKIVAGYKHLSETHVSSILSSYDLPTRIKILKSKLLEIWFTKLNVTHLDFLETSSYKRFVEEVLGLSISDSIFKIDEFAQALFQQEDAYARLYLEYLPKNEYKTVDDVRNKIKSYPPLKRIMILKRKLLEIWMKHLGMPETQDWSASDIEYRYKQILDMLKLPDGTPALIVNMKVKTFAKKSEPAPIEETNENQVSDDYQRNYSAILAAVSKAGIFRIDYTGKELMYQLGDNTPQTKFNIIILICPVENIDALLKKLPEKNIKVAKIFWNMHDTPPPPVKTYLRSIPTDSQRVEAGKYYVTILPEAGNRHMLNKFNHVRF